jgi:predicted phage terminase large subunit-like protein
LSYRPEMDLPPILRARVDPYELDRQIVAKGGLHAFTRLAWAQVEGEIEFVDNWHVAMVCAHWEAMVRGEVRRLLINIPPGCMKSKITGVFGPAWTWGPGKDPGHRFMNASYDGFLTRKEAMATRSLIMSDWYQQRWGFKADPETLKRLGLKPIGVIVGDDDFANTSFLYWSTKKGMRFATSFGGRATGWHAHTQIFDDPTNPTTIQRGGSQAAAALEETHVTYKQTFSTRKANPKKFNRMIVMQRLADNDLVGAILREDELLPEEDRYTKVVLPMEYDPDLHCKTPWGEDPRKVKGELLWPARFDAKSVATTKRELGSLAAAAQLGQRPNPAEGTKFKAPYFTYRYKALPAGGEFIQCWDASFAEDDGNDYCAGQIMMRLDARYYVVDRIKERFDFPSFIQAILDWADAWPEARAKVIENKANGPAAEQTLRKKVPGIVLVNPLGSKESRFNAVADYWQAGNIWLPERAAWVAEYVREHLAYPTGLNDDEIDCTTTGVLYWEGKHGNRMAQALLRLKQRREAGIRLDRRSTRQVRK